jgi:hypothetical protein
MPGTTIPVGGMRMHVLARAFRRSLIGFEGDLWSGRMMAAWVAKGGELASGEFSLAPVDTVIEGRFESAPAEPPPGPPQEPQDGDDAALAADPLAALDSPDSPEAAQPEGDAGEEPPQPEGGAVDPGAEVPPQKRRRKG